VLKQTNKKNPHKNPKQLNSFELYGDTIPKESDNFFSPQRI